MITGWESADVLSARMAEVLDAHAQRIASERLTVGGTDDGVLVVVGADGFLVSVEIAAWVRRRHSREQVAELVVAIIRKAELAAAQRRRELVERALDSDRNTPGEDMWQSRRPV